jgi:hypothetical protein
MSNQSVTFEAQGIIDAGFGFPFSCPVQITMLDDPRGTILQWCWQNITARGERVWWRPDKKHRLTITDDIRAKARMALANRS